jgi:large subunit ribosomal protein L5
MDRKLAKKIQKIVVNVGLGRMSQQQHFEDKVLPDIINELALITGQKPAPRKAKKSIAGFKLREGQIVGVKSTLRRGRMVDFLEKLIRVVFPRVRDFQGISLENIDSRGNLSVGLKDCAVFPEINSDILKIDFGLEISIVPNIRSREEAIEFYRAIGMPLKKT